MSTIGRPLAIVLCVAAAALAVVRTTPPAIAAADDPPVVVQVDGRGFDWRDAGVGAAGALAVVLLVVGAALTVRTRGGGLHDHREATAGRRVSERGAARRGGRRGRDG